MYARRLKESQAALAYACRILLGEWIDAVPYPWFLAAIRNRSRAPAEQ